MRSPFIVFGPAIRRLESWSTSMVTECISTARVALHPLLSWRRARRMTPRYGMGFSLLCQRRPGFAVTIGLDLVGVMEGQPHGMQTILLQNCTGSCYGLA